MRVQVSDFHQHHTDSSQYASEFETPVTLMVLQCCLEVDQLKFKPKLALEVHGLYRAAFPSRYKKRQWVLQQHLRPY